MRQRRNYLILMGLIVAAVVGAILLIVPGSPAHKKAHLGLDLQGGLEVVLKAVPPKSHKITPEDLDRSVSIMRNRIDKLGVSEPELRKQGSDQIVIQLAGVHDPRKAAELIGKTAQLELFDLEADLTGPSISSQGIPTAAASLYDLLATQQAQAKAGTPTGWYVFDDKKRLVAGPVQTRAAAIQARDSAITAAKAPATPGQTRIKRSTDPSEYKLFAVPAGVVVITCGTSAVVCPGVNESPPTRTYYYLMKYRPGDKTSPVPEMTGGDLKLSGTRQDFDPQTSQPEVLLAFTGAGRKRFHEITKAEAVRGRTAYARFGQGGDPNNFNQHFAIVLDRDIKSFPSIDFNEFPGGIDPTNGARITGIRSAGEAKDLALVLQTGALPVEFKQIERTDVSATLGKDSLKQAKKAALIGLLVVALFLLIFYRFLGLIAVAGLAIYSALLYAAILLLNVTLTLPGFAGLILTIGVAADANVVIFERIKEEVRSGRSIRAAIAAGYQRGFHTIVDANVVTCITAFVLFAAATAQVKGFALMLLLGTVISLVTAVAATRAMLGLLAGFRWFDNPRFMGATGQTISDWQRIDVCGPKRRRIWLTAATVAILLSVVVIAVKGLNLGIDFKGGTQVTFKTTAPTALSKVRDEMGKIGKSDAVVQGRGASPGGDRYTSFQIRTKSLTSAQQDKLQTVLNDDLGATSTGVKNVSSSFSRQIARGAIFSVLVSFLLIALYITFRFQWRFAIPILRTLFNDILITLGVYALSGREVTTATVAAVLTVLGYSIYDTIIVFDRVRENMPLMPKAKFATIANVSLWETMRRSLATTFITLLPVGSLLLFGGATLKDFAFALFIGIGLGAISTFFVATPFLTVLMERAPEFKRRTEGETVVKGVSGVTVAEAEKLGLVAVGEEVAPESVALEVPPVEADGEPVPAGAVAPPTGRDGAVTKSQSKREQRRQRRRSRPHGRAR
ncbi:MAG TPA: protein translocase subunit SecD [Gaiellaceae bacterium]|nr:protein translocase subunit SecD [Gaiellaceae bacterium]